MIGDPVCLVRFYRSEFWFRKNLYSIEDWGPIWPTLYVYPGEWLEEAKGPRQPGANTRAPQSQLEGAPFHQHRHFLS